MRDNYSFKKRIRELARKKKQDEKKQRKLDKKNAQITGESPENAASQSNAPAVD